MVFDIFKKLFINEIDIANNTVIEANKLVYQQDINAYKKYIEASELYKKYNEIGEYYNTIKLAVNQLIKLKLLNSETINTINILIDYYITEGKFDKLGELYKKLGDIENPIFYYKEAIKSYELTNHSKYILKNIKEQLADIYLINKNYFEAYNLYDQIIESNIDSRIIVKCILCIIANDDVVHANIKYQEKIDLLNVYEKKLLENILKSLNDNDIELYSESCYEYNNIRELNNLLVELLLDIKNTIFIDCNDENIL